MRTRMHGVLSIASSILFLASPARAQNEPGSWFEYHAGPGRRLNPGLTTDLARSRIVLFGGHSGAGPRGDTLEWNGDDWVTVATTGPSPRQACAMSYDPGRQRVVVHGGVSGAGALSDLWEGNGIAWRSLSPVEPRPPAISGHSTFGGANTPAFSIESIGFAELGPYRLVATGPRSFGSATCSVIVRHCVADITGDGEVGLDDLAEFSQKSADCRQAQRISTPISTSTFRISPRCSRSSGSLASKRLQNDFGLTASAARAEY